MGRPRRVSTADTLAPVPAGFDSPAPGFPSLAPIEPEPAPEVPQRTPERQRLADAITTVRRLEAEIHEASAAKAEAEEARFAAASEKNHAEMRLQQARPRDVSAWTPGHPPAPKPWGGTYNTEEEAERARRVAELPPLSTADATAALDVAIDAHDSARRAVQYHQERIDRASERLSWSRSSIDTAVRAVAMSDPALMALAVESRRLATRAEAAREAFALAAGGQTPQSGSPFYRAGQVVTARDGGAEAIADWSVSRDWRAALEALCSDPDAPLPNP